MRVDLEIQKRKLRLLRNTLRKVDKKKGFENKSLECNPHRQQKSGTPYDIWRRTVEKEATAVGRTWGQIGDQTRDQNKREAVLDALCYRFRPKEIESTVTVLSLVV